MGLIFEGRMENCIAQERNRKRKEWCLSIGNFTLIEFKDKAHCYYNMKILEKLVTCILLVPVTALVQASLKYMLTLRS